MASWGAFDQGYRGMAEDKHCTFQRSDGGQCRAFHQLGRPFCFAHDPERDQARRDAGRKAALSQQLTLVEGVTPPAEVLFPSKPLKLKTAKDVRRAIAFVLRGAQSGQIPEGLARTLFYGLEKLIQAIRDLDAPERLERLEKALRERGML